MREVFEADEVHLPEGIPTGIDLLLYDANEGCWRIGHVLIVDDDLTPLFVDGSVADNLSRDCPASIIDNVSHWAHLPDHPRTTRL